MIKKIILFFTIFIVLICISSFSWAVETPSLMVDFSYVDSSFGSIDFYRLFQQYFPSLTDTDLQLLDGCFSYVPSKPSSNGSVWYIYVHFYNKSNTSFYYTQTYTSSNGSWSEYRFTAVGSGFYRFMVRSDYLLGYNVPVLNNTPTYVTSFSNYGVDTSSGYLCSSYVYSNSNLTELYTSPNERINPNNSTFYSNSYIITGGSGGDTGGGDTGGGDIGGGDDNGSILDFITGFWNNLSDFFIHLIIPTSEQLEDLQDDFANVILHPLGLDFTAWTFNSNLQYTENEQGGYLGQQYLQPGIHFRFNFLNTPVDLDLSFLHTMLFTSISYGSWHTYEESLAINQYYDIPTSRY